MSDFTGNLQYKKLESGLYRISKSVRFYKKYSANSFYIELQEGSITNFASIPKFMRFIFPIDHEDYKMAAAFHDYLVGEFSHRRGVVYSVSGQQMYYPSWQESAKWFRLMIKVRQQVRREKRNIFKRTLGIVPDFLTRWIFYYSVLFYGLIK